MSFTKKNTYVHSTDNLIESPSDIPSSSTHNELLNDNEEVKNENSNTECSNIIAGFDMQRESLW